MLMRRVFMKRWATCLQGVVFLALAIWQGSSSLHRYVTPAEALRGNGMVQVVGTVIVSDTGAYLLGDDGIKLPLAFSQNGNVRLESGKHAVALGMATNGTLKVDRILYKCPSKYER